MEKTTTIALSIGTAILAFCLTCVLAAAIVVAGSISHQVHTPSKIFEPRAGAMGELSRMKNDIEYGPVNLQAAKETKDGLFANIRARRAARCAPTTTRCEPIQVVQARPVYTQPSAVTFPVVEIVSPTLNVPLVEYPAAAPPPKLAPPANCPDGKCPLVKPTGKTSARMEAKTGAFVCSNCRKPCVGDEWHTDWNADGTPTTFLCRRCNAAMDESQKVAAFERYEARQAKYVNGTLHQEISQ